MKKTFKTLKITMLVLSFLAIAESSLAQGPPPPPSGVGAKGSSTNHGPGDSSAPIGNGTLILLSLAAAYGWKKVYKEETLRK